MLKNNFHQVILNLINGISPFYNVELNQTSQIFSSTVWPGNIETEGESADEPNEFSLSKFSSSVYTVTDKLY